MKVSETHNLLTCYPEVAKSIDFDATVKAWLQNSKKYVYAPCLESCFKITPGTSRHAIFKCLKNSEHNNWDARINVRTYGVGCPQCYANNRASQKEKDFENELVRILQLKDNEYKTNISLIPSFNKNSQRKLELDFVCEKLGIAVEFNGKYWHNNKIIKNKGFLLISTITTSLNKLIKS